MSGSEDRFTGKSKKWTGSMATWPEPETKDGEAAVYG
jgi:hypothetical protein